MSVKGLLLSASLLMVAMPAHASELKALQANPDHARDFDYCDWAFKAGGKTAELPNYDAMLERKTTTLSTTEWAATALLDAGTRIAQNADSLDACNNIFFTGRETFDTKLEASLKKHWEQAKYKKKKDKKIAEVQANLATHWVEDQAARRVYIASKTEDKVGVEHWARRLAVAQTSLADDSSSEYMRELLKDYDWVDRKRFGKRVSMAAWLMVQHADDHVDLQSLALSRMELYLKNKGVSKGDYAFLWDRVAVNSGKKQRYGTQPTWECTSDKKLTLQPMEDPENVNKRRKKMGLGSVEKGLEGMAKSVCG